MREELLHYEPRLIEEAVFLACRKHPQRAVFQRRRDRLYEIGDPEGREGAFQEFNRSLFLKLKLADSIERALREQPVIVTNVEKCVVARAPGKKEEGAELFVSAEEGLEDAARRRVRILLRPESLLAPDSLLTFLRHEFFHVADMLDLRFGYLPELPAAEGGPTHDRLLVERYRVLWDTAIDGRMVRRGWLPTSIRNHQRAAFRGAFPMFGDKADAIFDLLFDHDLPTHAALVALAVDPRGATGLRPDRTFAGHRCPLCGFPTHQFASAPEDLGDEARTALIRDFPLWKPSLGICRQCADLYRATALSAAAARLLPGGNRQRRSD